MPYSHLPRDKAEALEALERLLRAHVVDEDKARAAARLISGDPAIPFPAPPAAPPPAAPHPDHAEDEGEKAPPAE